MFNKGFINNVGLNNIKDVRTPIQKPKHIGHFIKYPRKLGLTLFK